jgi:O-antigen ligase
VTRPSSVPEGIAQATTALCFLLPLVFFPGLISLYRLPKVTFLACFICLLCWLWLFSQIRRKQDRTSAFPLFLPLSVYLLISALSLYKAINLYEGSIMVFQLIAGVALFWIAANYIDSEKAERLFLWIAISGGVVSLLGIFQSWGFSIPTLIPTNGPGSTFGARNMAAQYLLFVLPILVYLLVLSSTKIREWFYATLLGFMSTYFLYTGSRAAWGAALMSLMVLWFYLRLSGLAPTQILSLGRRKAAYLAGVTFFVLIMNLLPPYFISGWYIGDYHPSALARLGSMIELEEDSSAQFRLAIWANSLAIFNDHPLNGAGKGNFRFIYPLYARRIIHDPSFNPHLRAADVHNDYIQLLAETGVLGAVAFLWILFLLGRRFWRGWRATVNPQLLVLAFSLTALLTQAFWDFPFNLPASTAFFWIYAGLLWGSTPNEASKEISRRSKPLSFVPIALLTLCCTIFAILSLFSLRGEFYYSRGARLASQNKFIEAEPYLARAAQVNPFDYRTHFLQGLVLIKQKDYRRAIEPILRSLLLHPYNINALNNLGVAYASTGNLSKAVKAFETSIRIWPDYPEAHNNLGAVYALKGDKKKAVDHFRTALRLTPKHPKALKSLRRLMGGRKISSSALPSPTE